LSPQSVVMNATESFGIGLANIENRGGARAREGPRILAHTRSKPVPCFHGGAFFEAIGAEFKQLENRHHIINADVLDAWFDPSPGVLAALEEHLSWIIRTSPPTHSEGLVAAIAAARGIPINQVLAGAGSSDLIFLALRQWLTSASRVLILDPTYGEYRHVLHHVIGCQVDSLPLSPKQDYDVDLLKLRACARRNYDLIVLVNPNSPTGRFVRRQELQSLVDEIPSETCVWVDETYIDYLDRAESIETYAVQRANLVVCKSMSKAYALSGVRAAYLAGASPLVDSLRAYAPPWAVSLPAQVAAVAALHDSAYYERRYRETRLFRIELDRSLTRLGLNVVPGCANFLLFHLPPSGIDSTIFIDRCRDQGLFLRDAGKMSATLGSHAVRIAVKDQATNQRMVEIMATILRTGTPSED
jgi:histidinol-phosphate/aromatic aminotransferase/cobyric acid decarboxylase-like protein